MHNAVDIRKRKMDFEEAVMGARREFVNEHDYTPDFLVIDERRLEEMIDYFRLSTFPQMSVLEILRNIKGQKFFGLTLVII